jgi:hypothetical protein
MESTQVPPAPKVPGPEAEAALKLALEVFAVMKTRRRRLRRPALRIVRALLDAERITERAAEERYRLNHPRRRSG